MKEISVKITCINQTTVETEHSSWY